MSLGWSTQVADKTCANSDCTGRVHYHKNEQGALVACYHRCRAVFKDAGFWFGTFIGTTVSFPFEHWLYTSVYPFTLIAKSLGLD